MANKMKTYNPEEYLDLLLKEIGFFSQKNLNLTPEQSRKLLQDTIEQLDKEGTSLDEIKNPEFAKTLMSKLIETYVKTVVLPLVNKKQNDLTADDKQTLNNMPEFFKKLLNKIRIDKGQEPLNYEVLAKEKPGQKQRTGNQSSPSGVEFDVVDGNGVTVFKAQVSVAVTPNQNNAPVTTTVAAVVRGGSDIFQERIEALYNNTASAFYAPTNSLNPYDSV